MKIVCAAAPGYGLMLPVVPLVWAARAAGHEVLVACASEMIKVGADAGLSVYDVAPDRDVWDELMRAIRAGDDDAPEVSEEFRLAARGGSPFGLFTLTMTEGTIDAARRFGADLIMSTSDHAAGLLTAVALDRPLLEVGNRVTWSMRDADFARGRDTLVDDEVTALVRSKFDIPDGRPRTIARIDPRAPSMGGLAADVEPADPRDGAPWWSMRYVPFNGGSTVPSWALDRPGRPRVCVTLGTVVPTMSGTGHLEVVLDALGGLDVEVVLAAQPSDVASLGELPANVRSVGFLALSAFLPSCSLIVHHGGSGTTAAPLFYGVPQLVMPSFADNPMAAQRVADRGVGLSQEPHTATVEGLRAAITRLLTEPTFTEAAREVATEMATQPTPATIIDRAIDLVRVP
ncbi:nucleotide disphospho-sugar-binding domain-containing protein [Pseudonocardia spinosispora]|uniref:nucleotide disphospho-sugar-binding domain-containing protein n=1 Tax=Pseudonocardia spinosispora TaxID=103441 RepID=UPI000413B667|nr:nucleotide disphospho-sugar-binding domain-containing protein [Pseudonocardia spinosispora]